MKKTINLIIITLLFALTTQAQSKETDSLSRAEVSKLKFIEGNWAGKGWMYVQGGRKEEFEQTEKVQMKLDGTILLIEGVGRNDGKVIHNALAIVTWDKEKSEYNFRSYLATGRAGVFKGEIKEGAFYWYPNQVIRYIISLTSKGQWFEIGEMNRDGKWTKFFEMTLDRVQ
jgi:hypothetical protein